MGEGTSIVNLGELSKPATVLIEKISDAVGGVFRPWQIKRVAEAEANAEIIRAKGAAQSELARAKGQVELEELHERAFRRLVGGEAKKQENMEAVISKALPQLDENADPGAVSDDWLVQVLEKVRLVSDNEMQDLWAKILADEVNHPGRFSKRTINFVDSLDKTDAILFTELCRYIWVVAESSAVPLVYRELDHPIYQANGINFGALSHLETIGLVNFAPTTGYLRREIPKRLAVAYFGQPYVLEFPSEKNALDIGVLILTQVGFQLAPIAAAKSKPAEGFPECVLERWSASQIIPSSSWPRS
jgi:hypothetical protein